MASDWGASFASADIDAMTVYDQIMVPRIFGPWADALLDAVRVAPGETVLDIACGPGTVARRAAARVGPAGAVTACDLSPAMLAVAATKPALEDAAPITYLECSADALTVPDGAVDVALCQQGLQFFPDRVGALAEMRRALKPGGRVGASIWCAIGESPPFAALAYALGVVLGPETALAYERGPWGFTDAAAIAARFDAAGFVDVRVERRTLPVAYEGGAAQVVATLATSTAADQVAALDAHGRAALMAATVHALGPRLRDGVVTSELSSHVMLATR